MTEKKNWEVVWKKEAEQELEEAVGDKKKSKKIADKVNKQLADNPYSGKPLFYKLKGYWRIRFSKFRVIYEILEEQIIVSVVKVDKRSDVYVR